MEQVPGRQLTPYGWLGGVSSITEASESLPPFLRPSPGRGEIGNRCLFNYAEFWKRCGEIRISSSKLNQVNSSQANPIQSKERKGKTKELSTLALIPAKLLISMVHTINRITKNSLEICLFIALMLIGASNAQAELRQDCLAWSRSSGAQQQEHANRIGSDLLLTKNNRLKDPNPDHPQNLYRPQDIQRVCRGQ